ncbi:SPOR domain-containing protein [Alcaligenes sp. WGS1538]|uniref:SPOR domain-containing protein n=1 Tax=Alcaligenes sp. WGS1538 TaxID=3366811 RepID=UPI00372D7B28
MARARKKSSGSGGTYTGILIGLILGLGAAVAVALFVTKVPMPFVDKASREAPTVALPEGRDLLDPNRGLYGSDSSNVPPPAVENIPGLTLPSLPAPPAGQAKTTAAPAPSKPPSTTTTYYLQAGAFRNNADAEAMKARLLMLGFNASVQSAQVNGGTVNRVRMGPFKGIDEMNRARSRLAEEKIDTSVVRP